MIGWEFPPHIAGGLGVACAGLVDGLARMGQEIILLLPRARRLTAPPNVAGLSAEDILGCHAMDPCGGPYPSGVLLQDRLDRDSRWQACGEALAMDSSRAHVCRNSAVGTWSPVYGPNLFANVTRYARAAELAAEHCCFDVIHCHDWLTVPAGLAAARVSGKPLILHIHSLEVDRSGGERNNYVFEVERCGLESAAVIVAVSRYTRDRIEREYGIPKDHVKVVHNGLSSELTAGPASMSSAGTCPRIVFLGRMTWQKGPECFLHAARLVLEGTSHVRFVMGGIGELREPLVRLAGTYGIRRRVTFPGFIPHEQVGHFLAGAHALAISSVSEPFGLTALEAAAARVPVIVPRSAGVAEVLPAALTFDAGDEKQLAECMKTLLEDGGLRAEIIEKNYAAVQRRTWCDAGRDMQALYDRAKQSTRIPDED